jgi:ERF superfamily
MSQDDDLQNRFPPAVENHDPARHRISADAPRQERLEAAAATTATHGDLEQRKLFVAAFCAAQAAYATIEKNTQVEMRKDGKLLYSFWYADLGEIINKTRPALVANGLLFRQPVSCKGGVVTVTTVLEHVGGYREESVWSFRESSDKKTTAGDVTYVRRYMAGPALSVAGEFDSDDEGAETVAPDALIVDAWLSAEKGTREYQDWFMGLDEPNRVLLRSRGAGLKAAAENADREIANQNRAKGAAK